MKKRSDPREMARLLARREREDLSWAELARRTGVPVWKLRWWQGRLAKRAAGAPTPRFSAVGVVEPSAGEAPPFELILPSGLRVVVPSRFDPSELQRLLSAVGS